MVFQAQLEAFCRKFLNRNTGRKISHPVQRKNYLLIPQKNYILATEGTAKKHLPQSTLGTQRMIEKEVNRKEEIPKDSSPENSPRSRR